MKLAVFIAVELYEDQVPYLEKIAPYVLQRFGGLYAEIVTEIIVKF